MSGVLKGVIWDLDGTLYDLFEPGLLSLEVCFETAEKKGFITGEKRQKLKRKINGEKLYSYKFWKTIYEEDNKTNDNEDFPLSLIFKKAWFDFYDETNEAEQDKKCWENEYCNYLEKVWYKVFFSNIVPFSWVYTTLKELRRRGIAMGIISDSPVDFGVKKIKTLKIDDYFNSGNVIWTKEIGLKKPRREPFLNMSKVMGCAPYEVLVVGDVYHKDGSGARNAGMSFLPVNYGCDFKYFLEQFWDVLGVR